MLTRNHIYGLSVGDCVRHPAPLAELVAWAAMFDMAG